MNDKSLKALVEAELDWQPSIDASDIGVGVEDGIVRLTGRVPTYAQKFAAEEAVKRVKGVRGVADNLEVRTTAAPFSDEAVATRIANVLDWNVSVPTGAVQVKVEGGYVVLTGQVDWQYQRAAAERAVRPQQGVRGIQNRITVRRHAQASDVKHRIEAALQRQADVDGDNVRVSVEGSTVRLDGKVRGWTARDTIERAAWAAPGVTKVEDHVVIGL